VITFGCHQDSNVCLYHHDTGGLCCVRDWERLSGGNVYLEGPSFLNSRKISNERFPVQLTSQLEGMHFIIMREIWQTNLGKARTD
jgi:hypothetical protein